MQKIFHTIYTELEAGRGAVLCGIVSSHGSAPRSAGAKMLVLENGTAFGTIGGGAVEYHAMQLAGSLLRKKQSRFETYCLSAGETRDIGMICGGDVRVYFQYFNPLCQKTLATLEMLSVLLDSTDASWLVTKITSNGWCMGVFDQKEGLRGVVVPIERLEPLLTSRGVLDEAEDLTLYVEPLCRAGTVYLFGAGHVARELAQILAMTDFRVSVWDERPNAVVRAFFPAAAALHCGPFRNALAHLEPLTAEDYVVIMTPGHEADYEVLTQVLPTPAQYIGCIGSRKKVAATQQRLLADGFTAAEIKRVHSPIGLPIGGETPAEVAVSVAAQLVACRSGRLHAFDSMYWEKSGKEC